MLYDKLKNYSKSGIYPFHMPGHKRTDITEEGIIPYNIDITEIHDFDNLHSPNGVIDEIQKKAAKLYNAKNAFILINGSTGGILSAIRSMTNQGDKILMARNCHKSVYNSAELFNLNVDYIFPDTDSRYNILTSVSPCDIEDKLTKHNDEIRLVIITSPTYEGVVSDIKSISEICHKHGAKLLVDEAHGAHFPFSDNFPDEALNCGADAAVLSLHKTLPSLTQTALLITNDSELSEILAENLAVFETSSPSYILMSSIEECLDFCENSKDKFKEYCCNLKTVREKLENLKYLKIYDKSDTDFDYDIGKIVISTVNANISGTKLAEILRNNYQIETEMAYSDYVIAMTSVCDTEKGFNMLSNALISIDSELSKGADTERVPLKNLYTGKNFNACELYKFNKETIPFQNSEFRTSAEYIWAYPPGIPLIVPGEIISKELINYIEYLSACKVEIMSTKGGMTNNISVVKKD
nr:aminotransferase class V-fold PLP-dependent enzyme [Ruminococcus sp.]